MKASTIIVFLATQAIGALAVADLATREAQCGALGVSYEDPSEIPAGKDINDIRICRDHPSTLEENSGLQKRKCEKYSSGAHCSKKGWCYTNCGSGGTGKWCWLADKGGSGDWLTCKTDYSCNYQVSHGNTGCGWSEKLNNEGKDPYSCKGCGCNCH